MNTVVPPRWAPSPGFDSWPGCAGCRHYRGALACDAYPEGIPIVIASGTIDHLVARPGDRGIRFEAKGTAG